MANQTDFITVTAPTLQDLDSAVITAQGEGWSTSGNTFVIPSPVEYQAPWLRPYYAQSMTNDNQIISTGGSNTSLVIKYIQTLLDLPVPVGDDIQLENYHYVWDSPTAIDCPYDLIVPATGGLQVSSSMKGVANLNYTGNGSLFKGIIDTNVVIYIDGTYSMQSGNFLALGGDWSSVAQFNAVVLNTGPTTVGWGTIDDIIFITTGGGYEGFSSGLIFTDVLGVNIGGGTGISNWQNAPNTNFLEFYGDTWGGILVNNNLIIPGSNEYGIYVDPASFQASGQVVFTTTNDRLINPAGKNHKDPYWVHLINGVNPDSQTIGALLWAGNTTDTVITELGSNGVITAFADAGGGKITVTSAGHGRVNGSEVAIDATTNYHKLYTIDNITLDTFEITETWLGNDATGEWTSGWVKVQGLTYASESIQRCSMTADNELTFANLERKQGNMRVSIDTLRGAGSGSPTFEFVVFQNGGPALDSHHHVVRSVDTNSSTRRGCVIDTPLSVIAGDTISLYSRNITNTSNVVIKNGTMILD